MSEGLAEFVEFLDGIRRTIEVSNMCPYFTFHGVSIVHDFIHCSLKIHDDLIISDVIKRICGAIIFSF